MAYALDHALIATPIGMIRISGDEDAIGRVLIDGSKDQAEEQGRSKAVVEAVAQIRAYFAGALKDFDLPLIAIRSERGDVLREGIASVGYGQTLSYGALARTIGSGARAIGQACARNPYPLIIPCHRILASGGALGAYSAGDGPLTKQWLLDHESRHI
ncbi:methylated-DNA--[protein]-cysteine S-methyltransferase [Sphingobium boeckii]|uniref:Methylated-DNA--protein-cysteine methyltransferase n=1 Tax=Sphingobium boeckii TaxID=1082345 RepID=A0A7W9EDX9_9SPHN|nr:methylated-DNA--[protein]-cysteine S-methyltransferase [Sphingobium boeckii]MBB5684096.1 methylated-DNA-[protein]-cysteine S-methyltransferase [Sphingobium boeckii]